MTQRPVCPADKDRHARKLSTVIHLETQSLFQTGLAGRNDSQLLPPTIAREV